MRVGEVSFQGKGINYIAAMLTRVGHIRVETYWYFSYVTCVTTLPLFLLALLITLTQKPGIRCTVPKYQ